MERKLNQRESEEHRQRYAQAKNGIGHNRDEKMNTHRPRTCMYALYIANGYIQCEIFEYWLRS